MMDDLISRQAAIDAVKEYFMFSPREGRECSKAIERVPSAQPERLTDDDFETIRIHLNSFKENLCNQRRWKEAEEYQHIIDRFMMFASAQPRSGKWDDIGGVIRYGCPFCHYAQERKSNFCPNCGADMRGDLS